MESGEAREMFPERERSKRQSQLKEQSKKSCLIDKQFQINKNLNQKK